MLLEHVFTLNIMALKSIFYNNVSFFPVYAINLKEEPQKTFSNNLSIPYCN